MLSYASIIYCFFISFVTLKFNSLSANTDVKSDKNIINEEDKNGQQTIYHFTKNNSPLPSNNINDIALDFVNGLVFIATDKGLVSFDSGGSTTSSTLDESYVYPNPVRPSFNMNIDKIKISGITDDINIKITDISGNLVAEANSNVNNRYNGFNLEIDGGVAYWNGKNLANNSVSSGVYIVMLSDLESYETKILKIMIIR